MPNKNLFDYFNNTSTQSEQPTLNISQLIPHGTIANSKLEAFTDGSALNNGKTNIKSGIGVYFPDDSIDNISINTQLYLDSDPLFFDLKPSNNVAELLAILIAIKILVSLQIKNNISKIIVIFSDSEYSINCITKWAIGWQKNGWIKKNKQPIKNIQIIKKIVELTTKYRIKFVHVNSHMPEPIPKYSPKWLIWEGNDRADKLANKGALQR